MTPQDLRTAFPQFKDVGDATLIAAITAMGPFFLDPGRYGDFLNDAQLNCAAHFVVFRLPDIGVERGANDATSETRPSLSISRSPELLRKQAHDPFMMTTYGRMYAYYRDHVAGPGGAAAVLSPAGAMKLFPPAGFPLFGGWW